MSKTLKEKFAEVTKSFKDLLETEVKFLDFKLADGTLVRCDTDELKEGTKIEAIDEKGKALTLPNGEYTNPETGVKFSVEAGYVKNVADAPVIAAAPVTPPATDAAPDLATLAAQIKDLIARVATLEKGEQGEAPTMDDMNKITQAQAKIEKTIKETNKKFADFASLMEETFAGEPISGKPKNFGGGSKTDEEKIKEFRKTQLNIG